MINQMQLNLNRVLYVSNLSKNLLSVAAMTRIGAEVLFDEGKCIISKNERKITIGHLVDSKLYMVNTDGEAHIASATSFSRLNYSYIDRLIKGKFVEGMSCSSGEVNRECEACAQGKMHRIPFPKKSEKETHQPLQLVHSDLCGPLNVDSVGGSKPPDIIPVSSDVKMLKAEKESLCKEFEMVDHFILGMSIKRDQAARALAISQGQYLKDLLKRFGMKSASLCQLH